ncbi:hypothetical protein [Lactobacillus sp. Sy-1]|uniref:hypothetical protein n=1 Tax=Lactobacillus sp. Sy-1 TaxID=2109645 RepID=UPI001C584060|nr:hypothetical protein [Lactobacillus sp. Sy-1]MBW1604822.1 hypothetical protein [Lactobacillus sp. Sy-1]
MDHQPQYNFVIRKKASFGRRIWHFCLFAALWAAVIFILVVNYGFIFDLYTDNLVTYYLLLNLDYGFYFGLLATILVFAIGTLIFSFYRIKRIRRKQENDTKNS